MVDAEIGGENTLTPDRGKRMKLYFLLCSQLASAAAIPTGYQLLTPQWPPRRGRGSSTPIGNNDSDPVGYPRNGQWRCSQ
jgi:hypothetical protein